MCEKHSIKIPSVFPQNLLSSFFASHTNTSTCQYESHQRPFANTDKTKAECKKAYIKEEKCNSLI